tara:strand:- start:9763 stop:10089 length:327 start_codon:yes stop_codon:yes gene_type:complete
MKKLILEEIVSLKRLDFKDKNYLQRLQQMVDESPSLKQWRNSGQLMNRKEYEHYYPTGRVLVCNNVFRYAGGEVIELTENGMFHHPDITANSLSAVEEIVYNNLIKEQ